MDRLNFQGEVSPYEADTIFPMNTAPNVLSRSIGGARCRNMAANLPSAAKQRDFISWCRTNKRHPAIAAPVFVVLLGMFSKSYLSKESVARAHVYFSEY